MPQRREPGHFVKMNGIGQIPERNCFRINKVFLDPVNRQRSFVVNIVDFFHRLAGFVYSDVFQLKLVALQFRGIGFHPFHQL